MAIKLFAPEPGNSGESKPFLNDLMKAEADSLGVTKAKRKWVGQPFFMHKFILVKSGKGALLQCEAFSCFLFKNSTLFKQMIEALKYYADELGECPGFVVIPTDLTGKFNCGIDDETTFFIVNEGGQYLLTDHPTVKQSTVEDGNPFLLANFGQTDETESGGTEELTRPGKKQTTSGRSKRRTTSS